MAQVDTDTIYLVGSWRSNTMIRYLHTMAKSFTEGLVVKIFQHGPYTITPPAHAEKYCHAELTGPLGPYYKGFLGPSKIIKQKINRRYARH